MVTSVREKKVNIGGREGFQTYVADDFGCVNDNTRQKF